jgi:hypothetical protein
VVAAPLTLVPPRTLTLMALAVAAVAQDATKIIKNIKNFLPVIILYFHSNFSQ